MAVKKSEIYSSLWKSCDTLHGSMDASDCEDYVVFLFIDEYARDRNASIEMQSGCGRAEVTFGDNFEPGHSHRRAAAIKNTITTHYELFRTDFQLASEGRSCIVVREHPPFARSE
jgi:hypothetical protein